MKKEEFLDLFKEEFPEASENVTHSYTSFQAQNNRGEFQNFIEIHFQKKGIKIFILSRVLNNEELSIFDKKPSSFRWTLDAEYLVVNHSDFEKILPMIKKSYDGIKEGNIPQTVYEEFKIILSKFIKQANININKSSKNRRTKLEGQVRDYPAFELDGIKYKVQMFAYPSYGPTSGSGISKIPYFGYKISDRENCWINVRTRFHKFQVIGFDLEMWYPNKKQGLNKYFPIKELELETKKEPNEKLKTFYDTLISYKQNQVEVDIIEEINQDKTDNLEDEIIYSELSKKLLYSHNLILRGAPGTGKTYLAKQIARELTDDNEEQIGFVQFHPSYDYTDFVEGLRPVKDDSGDIKFEIKSGIFKTFCEKAKIASQTGGQDNFEEAWKAFFEAVSEVDEDDSYVISSLRGKSMHLQAYERGGMTGVTEKDSSSNFYNKAQCYNLYKGKPGVPQGGFDNYRRAILNHLKEKFGLEDFIPPTETTSDKKFVFIIDEINRGEISKIFGELFFSIDPGYRGEDGAVSTQYANMHQEEEKFYIPENVYIIGTMNDIDRSVDSFDFAMRRRFRFVEIKAADSMVMWERDKNFDNDQISEARTRLTNLNQAIENTPELDSNYHIGPSYFLKLPELDYDYEILWQDYLQPLLEEYLRGTFEEAERLRELKAAYDRLEEETHVDEG